MLSVLLVCVLNIRRQKRIGSAMCLPNECAKCKLYAMKLYKFEAINFKIFATLSSPSVFNATNAVDKVNATRIPITVILLDKVGEIPSISDLSKEIFMGSSMLGRKVAFICMPGFRITKPALYSVLGAVNFLIGIISAHGVENAYKNRVHHKPTKIVISELRTGQIELRPLDGKRG